MRRLLLTGLLVLAFGLSGITGYQLLRSGIEAEVYRARLEEVAGDYAQLRQQYNEAVQRTAVTELVVEDGSLRVAVRTAAGEVRSFDTPYDPAREIYVDYAVLDGRLWIRRVFDEDTPPGQGLLIDPGLAHVDWSADPESHGKAAYRALAEGRWVVSVTGDGSLGLAPSPAGERPELAPPPPVRRYEPVEGEVDDALRAVGPGEALRALAVQIGAVD